MSSGAKRRNDRKARSETKIQRANRRVNDAGRARNPKYLSDGRHSYMDRKLP